jgi:hypothetical protein
MEWHIHLGAHKTATTHFQDLLERNVCSLGSSGTLLVPRVPFRASKLLNQVIDSKLSNDLLDELTAKFSPAPPAQTTTFRRILISEENILGSSKELLECPIYSRAEKRLEAWADLLKGQEVKLYFAVRNFGQILPSAYSQATRQGFALQPFNYYLDRCLSSPPSWLELVGRIRSAFPHSTLKIWTFEDYIRDPAKFIRRLNVGEISSGELQVPASTRSLSATTLRKLQKLNSSRLPKLIRKRLRRYMASLDAGEGYKPMSADEIEFFSARYRAELKKINENLLLEA